MFRSRKKKAFVFRVTFTALTMAILSANQTFAAEPVTSKLTPRLHELLIDEMRSVKQAMEQIMNGLVVGDHSLVANMAQQIHNSFILKQQLTEKDKEDLMAAVPPDFVRLDQEFHETSKRLAEVADQKQYDLQRYYFGQLVQACQECHSSYVSDRFTAFSGKPPEGHSH